MLTPARALAGFLPAVLLLGALGFQYIGHLAPCEMCLWQRWPLYGALMLALLAILARTTAASRPLTVIAGFFILASGIIAVKHVGVERHWWLGPRHCAATLGGGGDVLRQILAARIVQCDVPQWTLLGVSLAGFNALFSLAGGITILILALRRVR